MCVCHYYAIRNKKRKSLANVGSIWFPNSDCDNLHDSRRRFSANMMKSVSKIPTALVNISWPNDILRF